MKSSGDNALTEKVANDIEAVILESDISKLPTEFELADNYNVSRTVIREALNILKERGLIKSKVGGGSFITKPDVDYLKKVFYRMILHQDINDSNFAEVRIILESGATSLAAKNRTPEFIKALTDNLEHMKSVKDKLEERIKTDVEFHELIAHQSRNPMLIAFISSISQIMTEYIKCRLTVRPEGNEDGILWHSFIINVLKNGTAKECEESMRSHLTNSFYQIESRKAMKFWLDFKEIEADENETLSRKVSDMIESSLLDGDVVKLPTELELAEKYNVSRTVIREALVLLKERGLVVSKVGVGAFYTADSLDISDVFGRISRSYHYADADLNNVRMILEKGAASLASKNVTTEFISKLKANYLQMEELLPEDYAQRIDVDMDFHNLIARQSGNPLLIVMIQSLTNLTREFTEYRVIHRPESYVAALNWHKKIIEAFEEGGGLGPETIMAAHLSDIYHTT